MFTSNIDKIPFFTWAIDRFGYKSIHTCMTVFTMQQYSSLQRSLLEPTKTHVTPRQKLYATGQRPILSQLYSILMVDSSNKPIGSTAGQIWIIDTLGTCITKRLHDTCTN